jgi:hypothetical protein
MPAYQWPPPKVSLLLPSTPWMEQLTPNGTEHAGADDRLVCLMDRLLRSRSPVTVAALGGSISAGSTYTVRNSNHLYHRSVATALRGFGSRGGSLSVSLHNGALPATGPSFFEHCMASQLPAAPDLVLVEFTVNLDHQPAAFERLIRKLLELPRRPAIVVVSMHAWRIMDVAKGRRVSPWRCKLPKLGDELSKDNHTIAARPIDQQWADQDPRGDEDRVAELCRHYNIPLVSMRAALLEAVRSGKVPLESFMQDCRHPNWEGHLAMAHAVIERLRSTSPQHPARTPRCPPEAVALPLPMHKQGMPMPNSMCARGELLNQFVVSAEGFEYTSERMGKPGMVGLAPGDNLSLSLFAKYVPFDGVSRIRRGAAYQKGLRCQDSPAFSDPTYCEQKRQFCQNPIVFRRCRLTCGLCRPQPTQAVSRHLMISSVLWIAYLSSYQHMGRALAVCSGGCACGPIEIDAHAPQHGQSAACAVPLARLLRLFRAHTWCLWAARHSQEEAGPLGIQPRMLELAASISREWTTHSQAPSERKSITAVQRLIVTHMDTGGRCLLRLTILPSTSSGEHKWKLIGLLLGENTAGDSWLPPGAMRLQGVKGDRAGLFFPGLNERVPAPSAVVR